MTRKPKLDVTRDNKLRGLTNRELDVAHGGGKKQDEELVYTTEKDYCDNTCIPRIPDEAP